MPVERLFADWDNYDGEPPGQTIVFADTLGTMVQIAVRLDPTTSGRDDVLRKAFSFAESLMESGNDSVVFLAIDSVAEVVDAERAGREVWSRLAGPMIREWYGEYGRAVWHGSTPEPVIDLWGVRAEIQHLLPDTPLQQIPGISYPAAYLSFDSIEEARLDPEGTVLLSAFGTGRPFVVARATDVVLDDSAIAEMAKSVATHVGGEASEPGKSGAHLRKIPLGERVWNMGVGDAPHSWLTEEIWTANDLSRVREPIIDFLTGKSDQLELPRPRLGSR